MIELKISKEVRHTYGANGVQVTWQWCRDNFGPAKPYGNRWYWDTDCKFCFHHEQDAVLFALKWT